MSLPGAGATCVELDFDLSVLLDFSVTLPGGLALNATLEPGQLPSLPAIVGSMLGPLNAAMAPLMPFFRILDVIVALVEFSQIVPRALGPPPKPIKLLKTIQKVVKAASHLAALVPPLSIPIMIVGFCKVITGSLDALLTELQIVIDAEARLDLARARAGRLALDPDLAAGAAELAISIDCAQADLDIQVATGAASLGPVNRLLDLINALCDLAHLPHFLTIDASGNATALVGKLHAGVEAIEKVCASLPS